jgi:hypothetical protein
MRREVPLGDLPVLIQTCVDRQEHTIRIGSQTGIIDCCAGIGGFSMGVVDATKASIPLAIENDADIAEQYGKLHPATVVVDKGVAFAAKNWGVLKVRTKMDRFKYVIIQAGVPCQPFSGLNRSVGVVILHFVSTADIRCRNRNQKADDPRIGIIFEVLSLLQISGATHLLIECVDGMLYHRNGTENGEQAEIICIALRILVDLGSVLLSGFSSVGLIRPVAKLDCSCLLAISIRSTCIKRPRTELLSRDDGSLFGPRN